MFSQNVSEPMPQTNDSFPFWTFECTHWSWYLLPNKHYRTAFPFWKVFLLSCISKKLHQVVASLEFQNAKNASKCRHLQTLWGRGFQTLRFLFLQPVKRKVLSCDQSNKIARSPCSTARSCRSFGPAVAVTQRAKFKGSSAKCVLNGWLFTIVVIICDYYKNYYDDDDHDYYHGARSHEMGCWSIGKPFSVWTSPNAQPRWWPHAWFIFRPRKTVPKSSRLKMFVLFICVPFLPIFW